MAYHFFIFSFLIFALLKLLAKAHLEIENLRAPMPSFGNVEGGGVRFKADSLQKMEIVNQITPEQKRKEKIVKEQAKVDFINQNSNGLWKASLFLPFALMEDEEKELLYGTIPEYLAEDWDEEEAASFNSTYVNLLLEKMDGAGAKFIGESVNNQNHRRGRRSAFAPEFDARKMWPECAKIIKKITRQGKCGSCWAMVSAAVLSDRICIWRLKKFEGILAKWTNAVENGKRIGRTMADWNYFGNLVEEIWTTTNLAFANNFKEGENVEIGEEERAELKENWYKLLMDRWIEKNSMEIKNMGQKMGQFELWFRAMKLGAGMKGEMRNRWCQNVHRLNVFECEWPLLRRMVGIDYKRIVHLAWEEPGQKWEHRLKMAEMQILERFRYEKMVIRFGADWSQKSQHPSEEEFVCMLQEIRAGQWNYELGISFPKAKLAKDEKMEIWMKHLMNWAILEEYKDWGEWEEDMRKLFKDEADKPKNIVSAFHMLTCALQTEENKCEAGGLLSQGFKYAKKKGMVSGLHSDLGPQSGCKPYKISPSFNVQPQNPLNLECEEKCSNQPWGDETPGKIGKHRQLWLRDNLLKRGIIEADIERMIMAEIMQNGSVGANILKANSIQYYKEGIYSRTNPILTKDQEEKIKADQGKEKWVHSIRLIGWGQENGVKFWIAANSWGSHWGEKGFVRIIRGQNEVGIESEIIFPILD